MRTRAIPERSRRSLTLVSLSDLPRLPESLEDYPKPQKKGECSNSQR
jgi:hypothetical protein